MLKWIDVLYLFNLCPEALTYVSTIAINWLHSIEIILQKSKLSSTKNRRLMQSWYLAIGILVINTVTLVLLSKFLNASFQKMKR